MAIIPLVQFTCGLSFSIYVMISELLGFFDGIDISPVQGRLIIGFATAALTIFTA